MTKLIEWHRFVFASPLPATAKHWLSLAGFSHPKTDSRQKSYIKTEEMTKQQQGKHQQQVGLQTSVNVIYAKNMHTQPCPLK